MKNKPVSQQKSRRRPVQGIDGEVRAAIDDALRQTTPGRRLTVLALLEHPGLLDAVDTMMTELREGLR